MRNLVLALALLLGANAAARGQEEEAAPARPPADERLARILARAGEGVARYQAGLFHIAFTETLRYEELRKDMTPKKSKEFIFDTVVLREELSTGEDDYYPMSVRRLKTVDGKRAKGDGGREAGYGRNVASLAFLLPKNRGLFEFTLEGEEAVDGRPAYRVRLLRPGQGEPRVVWQRRLLGMSFRAIAPTVYKLWVDAENFDVLRVEYDLLAPFEFDSPRAIGVGPLGRIGPSRRLRYAVEHYAVRFRRQQFKDPEQTLLVPESAEWLTVIEGANRPRTRATLRFSDYRRFRSDVKVIDEPGPER
jgi:hypothetical protein